MMPHRAQGGSNDPASWFETRGVAALLTMGDWQRANLLTMRNACRANHFAALSSPICKNISVLAGRKSLHKRRRLVPPRGAARDRHERGAGCGGRESALDDARVSRTMKPCGPDVSTLASS